MTPLGPGDFTHFVLAEEFTATWCHFCPTAAEQLGDIYQNDGYEFYFVALIGDVNDKAEDRMGDYPTATGYPTVEFDGGDEEVSGQQDDKSTYQEAIETCGARDDTPISLEMNMSYLGNSALSVTTKVRWDEDGTIINADLQVYIRVYITEIESRYDNNDGNPYHFGFLDYAYDQQLDLQPQEWLELETTWIGADHEDANGDDFGDIDYENIALVAAIFNDETSESDKFSLQCAGTIAPSLSILNPLENDSVEGDFTLQVESSASLESGDPTAIETVEYSIDNGFFTTLVDDSGAGYSTEVDTKEMENGNHIILVRSTDQKGTTNEHSINFTLNGEDRRAPEIAIVSPEDGGIVKGNVEIRSDITDESAINSVRYQIDEDEWKDMDHDQGDRFIADWDSTNFSEGQHTLTISAEDEHGNDDEQSIEISVDNEEEDVTEPTLTIEQPANYDELSGTYRLMVHADDEFGIDKVEFRLTGSDWEEMTYQTDDLYSYEWNTTQILNDDYTIEFQATDTSENQREKSVQVTVNNIEDTDPPLLNGILPTHNTVLSTQGENGGLMVLAHVEDEGGLDKVECSLDEGPWIEMEYDPVLSDESNTPIYRYDYSPSSSELTGLEDGAHDLLLRASDEEGNTAEDVIRFEVDNTPPTIGEIEVVPGTRKINEPIRFWVEVTDQAGVDEVELIYELCKGETCLERKVHEMSYESSEESYYFETSFENEGTVKYQVVATDDVGNTIETEYLQFDLENDTVDDDKENEEPVKEIDLPSGVLLTNVNDADILSGTVVLEGGAYSSDSITMKVDGITMASISTRRNSQLEQMDDFTLTDLEGESFSLADFSGKVVILDFMATWCEGCKSVAYNLKEIETTFGNNVVIITIDVDQDETKEDLRDFSDAHNSDWRHAFDTAGLEDEYGIDALPTLMIITPDGRISSEHTGVLTVEELEGQIGMAMCERVWSFPLDTTTLENGYHTISLNTKDGSESETVVFMVDNPAEISNKDGDEEIDTIVIIGAGSLIVGIIAMIGIGLVLHGKQGGEEKEDKEEDSYYCWNCNDELDYVDDYDAWYCGECEEYR